jgi:hypothetical protein
MTKYEALIARKRAEYGDKFDDSALAPNLIDAYNSGERITIQSDFWRERGRIGVTSGWRPCFLLMRRISDRGSSYMLKASDTIVA